AIDVPSSVRGFPRWDLRVDGKMYPVIPNWVRGTTHRRPRELAARRRRPVRGEALHTCPTSGQMVRERRTTMRVTPAPATAPARRVPHLHPFASRFARVPYRFTGTLLPFLVTVVAAFFTIVLVAHLDQDETAITNAAFAAIATLGALSFSGARAVEEPAREGYV